MSTNARIKVIIDIGHFAHDLPSECARINDDPRDLQAVDIDALRQGYRRRRATTAVVTVRLPDGREWQGHGVSITAPADDKPKVFRPFRGEIAAIKRATREAKIPSELYPLVLDTWVNGESEEQQREADTQVRARHETVLRYRRLAKSFARESLALKRTLGGGVTVVII